MIDFQAQLYNPIYASELCVDATITTSGGDEMEVRAKNATVPSSFSGPSGAVDFQAFRPSAIVRMAQLLSLNADLIIQDDIQGGTIEMDGKVWSIKSYEYIPAPTGINTGELRLFLKDD
ncbi:MAG TPA: hypothetical protein VFK30_04405, partial [Anaerolineae bacterium]|nr:hypothetical protein [Anaerolineae bacterium]